MMTTATATATKKTHDEIMQTNATKNEKKPISSNANETVKMKRRATNKKDAHHLSTHKANTKLINMCLLLHWLS